MESQKDQEPEAVWAVVEQMGHQQAAGRLSEEEKFGGKIGRVDVPLTDGTFATQYFGAASVFRIRIVTEAVARAAAQYSTTAPIHAWDFPKQLPAKQEVPWHDSQLSHGEVEDDLPTVERVQDVPAGTYTGEFSQDEDDDQDDEDSDIKF